MQYATLFRAGGRQVRSQSTQSQESLKRQLLGNFLQPQLVTKITIN